MNCSLKTSSAARLRALVLLIALFGGGLVNAKSGGGVEVPGELLVKLRSTSAIESLLSRYPLSVVDQFGARPIYRLEIGGSIEADDLVAALELEVDVLLVEPNVVHESPEATRNRAWAVGEPEAYQTQWAPAALGLSEAHLYSTGEGVRVAVLDTGVDATHPALVGKVLPGFDFVDGDNDPSEDNNTADGSFGHGTHVAGLVTLVAPSVRILPLRVLDTQAQTNAWVLAEAMLYALNPDGDPSTDDGAHVINVSLGSHARTEILDTVMKLAACAIVELEADPEEDLSDPGYDEDKNRCSGAVGAVVVAAAGNDGSRRSEARFYPAAEGGYGLISVGASTAAGQRAGFSNYGSKVDVLAPGEGITSTVPNDGYGTWSGTSMATPLASGTAALVRAVNPGIAARDVARQVIRRGSNLCDTDLDQVNPVAALLDIEPARPNCN